VNQGGSRRSKADVLRLFSDTYAQADARFHRAALAAGAETITFEHPLKGPDGEMLRLTGCRIGPADAHLVVLVSAGTHGVEGFAGSAIQTGLLERFSQHPLRRDVAVIMVHVVNPWGMAWDRREDADNIDLFRNFVYCEPPFAESPLYDQLNAAINPTDWSGTQREEAERAIAGFIAEFGEDRFIAVVRKGQHSHPQGLTYHGRGTSWSKRCVDDIARKFIPPGARIANLEVHTSWGPPDKCLAISYAAAGSAKLHRSQRWIKGPLYLPGADPLIPAHPFTPFEYLERLIPGVDVTAVVMECGTYDGEMPLDLDRECNFVFTRGDPGSPLGLQARASMRRYCYPDSDDWKLMVWTFGESLFDSLAAGLHDW
jgi:hypothetical protein